MADVMVTKKNIWYPFGISTPSLMYYRLLEFCFHIIPALLVDSFCWLTGKATRMLPMYRKIRAFNMAVAFALNTNYLFKNEKMLAIYDR